MQDDALILPIKLTEHTLPDNDDTVYYCKMFKLPDDKPYHVAKCMLHRVLKLLFVLKLAIETIVTYTVDKQKCLRSVFQRVLVYPRGNQCM